jgi:photosystem II stability/assembly factor-like uncharacterized protein
MTTSQPGTVSRRQILAGALSALLGVGRADGQGGQPVEIHHVHGFGFDPVHPDVLFVATHTGLVRLVPDTPPAWVGDHRFDLMGFTIHPTDPTLVFASGHPDLATYRREQVGNLGLLVSRDGGRRWQAVALRGAADFHALTWSPRDGGELYGWSVAGERGLHRISTRTWQVERPAARGLRDAIGLSASPAPDGPVLAATRDGLLASADRGETWHRIESWPAGPATAVAHEPGNGHRVYAFLATQRSRLLRSDDGRASWVPTGYPANPDDPVVVLGAGRAGRVAAATTKNVLSRSADAGRTWRPLVPGQHRG